jgi:mono/diheme cytochrome c family protein
MSIIKLTMAFAFSFVLISSCGGSKEKKEEVSSASENEVPAVDGKRVFKINCVLCHGEDGKLGANGSKDLTMCILTLEERIAQITNGKGTMAAYGPLLTKEEIKAVAEYTMKFKK